MGNIPLSKPQSHKRFGGGRRQARPGLAKIAYALRDSCLSRACSLASIGRLVCAVQYQQRFCSRFEEVSAKAISLADTSSRRTVLVLYHISPQARLACSPAPGQYANLSAFLGLSVRICPTAKALPRKNVPSTALKTSQISNVPLRQCSDISTRIFQPADPTRMKRRRESSHRSCPAT